MLDALFKPKAVAIIGASTKELSIGTSLSGTSRVRLQGSDLPDHPTSRTSAASRRTSRWTRSREQSTFAHIIIPAKLVPQAIGECGKKGVKAVVINSAGFSEMGEEGATLQAAFLANARKYGVRVFGPTARGSSTRIRALKAYWQTFTSPTPSPGPFAVWRLSGGGPARCSCRGCRPGVAMADVRFPTATPATSPSPRSSATGGDDAVQAIAPVQRGFSDPKEFLDVAREVAKKKPSSH